MLLKNLAILPEIDRKLSVIDRKLSVLLKHKDWPSSDAPTPLEVARQDVEHDGLTHLPREDASINQEQFSDTIHASDTYCHGKTERRAYIDGQLSRLYRIFVNLHSLRNDLQGPTLDVASGWGILYPAYKKYLKVTLPYSVAEMSDYQEITIDGDAIDGCEFQCEKDILRYQDQTFGLVCFFDCLEHLIVDPMWTLLEFNRVLKLGGRLAISTPNAASTNKIFQIVQGENPATESHIKPASIYQRHNREWTPVELKRVLGCCGFANFYYSTNPQCLSQIELDFLMDLYSKGLVKKPFQYFGPELFLIAEKVQHITLTSDLPKEQRWPAWLYTGFDAYRKRPTVFPIIVHNDYS